MFLVIILAASTTLNNNCAINSSDIARNSIGNDTKLKTINTKDFRINYPNSWVKSSPYVHIILAPKKLKELNPEDEFNNISLKKNVIYVDKYENIEKTLDTHCNTLIRGEAKKEYEILKLNEDPRFICKVDYDIVYEWTNETYRRIEYFYAVDGKLDYLRIQMRGDLFEEYKEDIQSIIKSFKLKK